MCCKGRGYWEKRESHTAACLSFHCRRYVSTGGLSFISPLITEGFAASRLLLLLYRLVAAGKGGKRGKIVSLPHSLPPPSFLHYFLPPSRQNEPVIDRLVTPQNGEKRRQARVLQTAVKLTENVRVQFRVYIATVKRILLKREAHQQQW